MQGMEIPPWSAWEMLREQLNRDCKEQLDIVYGCGATMNALVDLKHLEHFTNAGLLSNAAAQLVPRRFLKARLVELAKRKEQPASSCGIKPAIENDHAWLQKALDNNFPVPSQANRSSTHNSSATATTSATTTIINATNTPGHATPSSAPMASPSSSVPITPTTATTTPAAHATMHMVAASPCTSILNVNTRSTTRIFSEPGTADQQPNWRQPSSAAASGRTTPISVPTTPTRAITAIPRAPEAPPPPSSSIRSAAAGTSPSPSNGLVFAPLMSASSNSSIGSGSSSNSGSGSGSYSCCKENLPPNTTLDPAPSPFADITNTIASDTDGFALVKRAIPAAKAAAKAVAAVAVAGGAPFGCSSSYSMLLYDMEINDDTIAPGPITTTTNTNLNPAIPASSIAPTITTATPASSAPTSTITPSIAPIITLAPIITTAPPPSRSAAAAPKAQPSSPYTPPHLRNVSSCSGTSDIISDATGTTDVAAGTGSSITAAGSGGAISGAAGSAIMSSATKAPPPGFAPAPAYAAGCQTNGAPVGCAPAPAFAAGDAAGLQRSSQALGGAAAGGAQAAELVQQWALGFTAAGVSADGGSVGRGGGGGSKKEEEVPGSPEAFAAGKGMAQQLSADPNLSGLYHYFLQHACELKACMAGRAQ